MKDIRNMQTRVTLKTIAAHVGLTPGTISAVLNNTRAADRIPQQTRDRVMAAARELCVRVSPVCKQVMPRQLVECAGRS